MQRVFGYVRLQGSGTPVANAQVEVFDIGTLIDSTIYGADDITVAKANPFTADANGFFFFFAPNGKYDLRFSGGTIPSAFTWGAVRTLDITDDIAITGSLSVSVDLSIAGVEYAANGTAALPSRAFTNATTTGSWWDPALSALSWSLAGVKKLWLTSLGLQVTSAVAAGDGAAATPAFTHRSDPTTGRWFDLATSTLYWAIAGANRLRLSATQLVTYGDIVPSGDGTKDVGEAGGRFRAIYANRHYFAGNVNIAVGAGSPEGSLTGPIGSLYLRTDGGAGTTLYIKESGVGDTGWAGV